MIATPGSIPSQHRKPHVVIGAGVFGLSVALELAQRGYQNIKVLDRYPPPVPDGSSVDISRVIRSDYADKVYNTMAREAMEGWKTEYSDHFHESGVAMLSKRSGNKYSEKSKAVSEAAGQKIDELEDANMIRSLYPGVKSRLEGLAATHNPQAGWADAASAVLRLGEKCSNAGVTFATGRTGTVKSLQLQGKRVVGVLVEDGGTVEAAQVILATGAWSNRLLKIEHATTASAQPVGFIQLTPGEAAAMVPMPVMINFETGVFIFPPDPKTHLLKLARHGWGFASEMDVRDDRGTVSGPKLAESNAASGFLPEEAESALREGLRMYAPQVAEREWQNRRLCWYSDTPEGDFIMDHHSEIEGLFVATGGAGQYVAHPFDWC